MGCKGVELMVAEKLVVGRASILGEIMALEQEGDIRFGEGGDEAGEEDVFSKGGIVNDPKISRFTDGLFDEESQLGGGKVRLGEVIKPIDIARDDDLVSQKGEGTRLGFDDAGDSARAMMVMKESDPHPKGSYQVISLRGIVLATDCPSESSTQSTVSFAQRFIMLRCIL